MAARYLLTAMAAGASTLAAACLFPEVVFALDPTGTYGPPRGLRPSNPGPNAGRTPGRTPGRNPGRDANNNNPNAPDRNNPNHPDHPDNPNPDAVPGAGIFFFFMGPNLDPNPQPEPEP